ncbi:hypothetical protein C2S51_038532 [Perilla frutescens var. frutescens]|nr:hypothetical protein C2S51_038532 [Perilla frutescens var. frutescens]
MKEQHHAFISTVEPALVQKLADRNHISLGSGVLHHIWFTEKDKEEKQKILESSSKENESAKTKDRKTDQQITVVTAALTYLANFEDVYRPCTLVAQFLDVDFVGEMEIHCPQSKDHRSVSLQR